MESSSPVLPRAILHLDGDGFFAACEQAVNPNLKGKPVVTGAERNALLAASYEAKALGIRRGISLWDAKKMCKDLVVLPSNFEIYSLFSRRMFTIMRRYTPHVEEYSVDEGFADITGIDTFHHTSYEGIAHLIQDDIQRELDVSVSVGVSTTKTLAKVASTKNKPHGCTILSEDNRQAILEDVAVEDIWNIGPRLAARLHSYGIRNAWQLAEQPETFIHRLLGAPGLHTWQELNGIVALALDTAEKTQYKSISKIRTFKPTENKDIIWSYLMRNIERACAKAQRYNQAPRKIMCLLKKQTYQRKYIERLLPRPSCYPKEVASVAQKLFDEVFEEHTLYRATSIILTDFVPANPLQVSLFESAKDVQKTHDIYKAIRSVQRKHGKWSIHHAASLTSEKSDSNISTTRSRMLLPGETKQRRLPLPLLEVIVN